MSEDRRGGTAPSGSSDAGRGGDGPKSKKRYYGKGKKYKGGARGAEDSKSKDFKREDAGKPEGAGDSGRETRGGRSGASVKSKGASRGPEPSGGAGGAGKPEPGSRPAVPPRPPRETIAERRARNLAFGPSFGTRSVAARGEDLAGLRSRMMTSAGESARERAMRVAAGLDYDDGDGGQFDY